MSTLVTENAVIAKGGLRQETGPMEAESGSHPSRTIAHSAHTSPQNAPILSLLSCLWHYNRCFAFTHGNSTHPTPTPNGREDVCRHKISSHNECLNIEKQQLHPLNCLIRLVIQYRSGPAPVPVPVPVPLPAPCFSSCPIFFL